MGNVLETHHVNSSQKAAAASGNRTHNHGAVRLQSPGLFKTRQSSKKQDVADDRSGLFGGTM